MFKLPISVTPENPFAFDGEPLRLCCNVTGTYRDRSDLDNITFYQVKSQVDVQPWSTQAVSVVCMNQTVPVGPDFEYMYYCAISRPGSQGQSPEQCMGYRLVRNDCKL